MVSASHNPGQYNGVKMVGNSGLPISGETGIFEIGKMIDSIKEIIEYYKKKKFIFLGIQLFYKSGYETDY
ncbi:MAG: hypothetical protein HGA94_04680, partial [Candidatus Aminicenantes bacterium]|nr:hypothetical protein [Candidatus Aminicenantes bacterium]